MEFVAVSNTHFPYILYDRFMTGKNELTKLHTDKKKQFGPLVRWLKVNFGECFTAWIHVKALRVFVESVLRFGLPVNFQGMVLLPQKKQVRNLMNSTKEKTNINW